MKTFVEKPKTVEAIQFTDGNAEKVVEFIDDGVSRLEPSGCVSVKTPHGFLYAWVGDWVVKDDKRRFGVFSADEMARYFDELLPA